MASTHADRTDLLHDKTVRFLAILVLATFAIYGATVLYRAITDTGDVSTLHRATLPLGLNNKVPDEVRDRVLGDFESQNMSQWWKPVTEMKDMKVYWQDEAKTSCWLEGEFYNYSTGKNQRLRIRAALEPEMVRFGPKEVLD